LNEMFWRWIYDPIIGKILAAVIGYLLIATIVFLIKTSVNTYVKETYFRYRVRKIFEYAGYFIALVFTTIVFSEQLGGLTVVLGIAGAGLAFALQEVIMSLAGWVAISLGNFYAPGDRVQLGGITGDVIDIGILRTTMMETGQWIQSDLYTGRVVRITNSFVFKEPVFNYSSSFPFLWDEIKIPIKYGSDHKSAKQIFQKIANDVTLQYAENAQKAWADIITQFMIKETTLEPQVTLAANDNWIEFTIRYIVDYQRRRATKDILFSALLDQIEQSGGRISIASTTIHLVETPIIKVRQTFSDSSET